MTAPGVGSNRHKSTAISTDFSLWCPYVAGKSYFNCANTSASRA
jgi:hypothetical protein